MKRDLAVILLIPEQKSKKAKWLNPCWQPLLGQSCLSLVAEKALSIKAQRRFIAGETIEKEYIKELKGWEIIEFKGEGKKQSLIDWLRNLFPEERPFDFLVINSCFPLLEKKSLKKLIDHHRRQEAGLTCLVTSRQNKEPAKGSKKRIIDSNLVAFIIPKENLSLAGYNCYDFLMAKDEGFLALKSWLEESRKKVLQVPLSEIESLDVRSHEARLKIISFLRQYKIQELQEKGVSFVDPASVWIDLKVKIGSGSVISPAVVIEGFSKLGREVKIHPFVHIIDSQIGPRSTVLSSCVIEGCRIGPDARVGPFTHLRPGTVIKAGAHVGNFVEMKKTVFGRRSKAMHLSYLGDSIVGDEVNIGAGTITCNYDGRQKHQTVIEKGAFIGSGTELVAPVKIGRGAYVGAGSTITKNVSPDALAIARAKQVEIPDWAKRRRGK